MTKSSSTSPGLLRATARVTRVAIPTPAPVFRAIGVSRTAFRACVRALVGVALGVALGLARDAWAHAPGDGSLPRLEITVRIDDRAVVEDLHLPLDLYASAALGASDLAGFRAVGRGERVRRLAAVLAERCPVAVDGVRVLPVLEELEVQVPDDEAIAKLRERAAAKRAEGEVGAAPVLDPIRLGGVVVRATYETKGRPERVSITWGIFPAPDASVDPPVEDSVVAEIDGFGRRRLEIFSPESREVLWERDAGTVRSIAAPPEPEPFSSPLLIGVTLGLLGAGLVCVVAAIVRRSVSWTLLATCFVIAAGASVPLAFGWGLRFAPALSTEEADRIFRGLHRNIYRAFDHVAESDVYDTLARSVDGPQLDEIYRGIYESLILHDDGGAVCKIERVEMLETEIVDPRSVFDRTDVNAVGGGVYAVRARWRVTGFVRHWGHTHRRVRELAALYAVAARESAWKIVAARVLREEDVSRPASVPSRASAGDPGTKGAKPGA